MTTVLYPSEGLGAPNDRVGRAGGPAPGLPAGTPIFSADNHLSLGHDIFRERFPESMKDKAPQVLFEDGAWTLGFGGKGFLPPAFTLVLQQYDSLSGASTADMEARRAELEADGCTHELAFPNALLGMMWHPDLELRHLFFRVYNEFLT